MECIQFHLFKKWDLRFGYDQHLDQVMTNVLSRIWDHFHFMHNMYEVLVWPALRLRSHTVYKVTVMVRFTSYYLNKLVDMSRKNI